MSGANFGEARSHVPQAPAAYDQSAVTYDGHQTVSLRPSRVSSPAPGEIQIEVAYVGLCGTDLHIIHGSMDQRVQVPIVFGHEASGRVSAIGEGTDGWTIGQPVTVMPLEWDGTCPACRAGYHHICQHLNFIGIDSPGAMQSHWNVPARTVIPLPTSLRLDVAALVEPTAVAVHDVRRAELRSGDKAVVLGGGPIGLLIASVARESGGDVTIVELDPARASRARSIGFTVLDPAQVDVAAWVDDWTAGAGADIVFEVSGAAAAVLSATAIAKVRGTIVVVAIHSLPREMDLQRIFWRELRVLGARVYQRTDFEEAIKLLTADVIPVEALVTHVVSPDRIAEAVAALESGEAMKVLVDFARGDA